MTGSAQEEKDEAALEASAKKMATRVRFELTRAEPIRLAV